jgi:outer membrane translocation and assembly module TamA
VFLSTVSGAAFADFGGAFDDIDPDDPLRDYHLGVGGELRFDIVVGYFVGNTLRLGLAHGLDDEAPGLQFYLVGAATF